MTSRLKMSNQQNNLLKQSLPDWGESVRLGGEQAILPNRHGIVGKEKFPTGDVTVISLFTVIITVGAEDQAIKSKQIGAKVGKCSGTGSVAWGGIKLYRI